MSSSFVYLVAAYAASRCSSSVTRASPLPALGWSHSWARSGEDRVGGLEQRGAAQAGGSHAMTHEPDRCWLPLMRPLVCLSARPLPLSIWPPCMYHFLLLDITDTFLPTACPGVVALLGQEW
jgi:hypothetical protein